MENRLVSCPAFYSCWWATSQGFYYVSFVLFRREGRVGADMAGTNFIALLIIVFFAVFLHHKTKEFDILEINQDCLTRGKEFSYRSSLESENSFAVLNITSESNTLNNLDCETRKSKKKAAYYQNKQSRGNETWPLKVVVVNCDGLAYHKNHMPP